MGELHSSLMARYGLAAREEWLAPVAFLPSAFGLLPSAFCRCGKCPETRIILAALI